MRHKIIKNPSRRKTTISEELLTAVHGKLEDSECFIDVEPPFNITIEPIEIDSIQGLAKDIGISEKDLQSSLRLIEWALLAELQDGTEDYIRNKVKHEIETGTIENSQKIERESELKEYSIMIKETLIDKSLKQRYKLKAESNPPFCKDTNWATLLKVADASGKGFRFPVLKIMQVTIVAMIPYCVGLLVAMVIAALLYWPAAIFLFFLAGIYVSKKILTLNGILGVVNSGYIKAILIVCVGFCLEIMVLIAGDLFERLTS